MYNYDVDGRIFFFLLVFFLLDLRPLDDFNLLGLLELCMHNLFSNLEEVPKPNEGPDFFKETN